MTNKPTIFVYYITGPLLYHYADMAMEMSIELSYEEVRRVIEQTGFVFEVINRCHIRLEG